MMKSSNGSRVFNVFHDHASVNVPGRIGIFWHHDVGRGHTAFFDGFSLHILLLAEDINAQISLPGRLGIRWLV